jgi:heme/copper-type cytochrome/quinol oxidase subunit 2
MTTRIKALVSDRQKWRWVSFAIAALLVAFLPIEIASGAPETHTIRVEASRFAYTPGTIRVNPGDLVTVELAAMDVVHGLAIDGYEVSMTADPGKTERLTFTADRAGLYRMRCTASCGEMHPFMIGKFQVGPNLLLARGLGLTLLAVAALFWRRSQ